jgi:hypothetical protein
MSGWVNALTEQALVNWVQSLEPTKLPFDLHMHIEVLRAPITLIIKIKRKSKLHSLSVCWGHPLTPFPKQKEEKKSLSWQWAPPSTGTRQWDERKAASITHLLPPNPPQADCSRALGGVAYYMLLVMIRRTGHGVRWRQCDWQSCGRARRKSEACSSYIVC